MLPDKRSRLTAQWLVDQTPGKQEVAGLSDLTSLQHLGSYHTGTLIFTDIISHINTVPPTPVEYNLASQKPKKS